VEDEPVHLAVAAHGHVVEVQELVQVLEPHPPLLLLLLLQASFKNLKTEWRLH